MKLTYIFICVLISTTSAHLKDAKKNFHYFLRSLSEPSSPGLDENENNHATVAYKVEKKDPELITYKLNGNPNVVKEFVELRRMAQDLRRKMKKDSRSSSVELDDKSTEFAKEWKYKEMLAMNSTRPQGDYVNMVAARPWGVPCGDQTKHDMPWGTCMFANECEPEFRIYKGDIFCGRTNLICCGLKNTVYDMYHGVESYEPDLSKEQKKSQNQRKNERLKRKRKIKKTLKLVVNYIKGLLKKIYRNGTQARMRKRKELKAYIKQIKRHYRDGRNALMHFFEMGVLKIDQALKKKLQSFMPPNAELAKEGTDFKQKFFGDIKLKEAFLEGVPDLKKKIGTPKRKVKIRTGLKTTKKQQRRFIDYNDYDFWE